MPTLKAYHRPTNLSEALDLLSRPGIHTAVVAGGTHIIAHMPETVDEVIDLQGLGLNNIGFTKQGLILGATTTLQALVDNDQIPKLLRETAKHEGPNTLRQAATLGGLIAGPDKESELLAALLVCDAEVHIQSKQGLKKAALSNILRDLSTALDGGIITEIELSTLGQTASDRVARTPADRPIVAAVARRGTDEKIRLALCGVDTVPILVNPDHDVKAAVNPPQDFRGSTEYRRQMAATLARRVISAIALG